MPAATRVVASQVAADDRWAWVVLAVEVSGTGYYLDENICERMEDGSWVGASSCGSGFTGQSLDSLRANPPRQSLLN